MFSPESSDPTQEQRHESDRGGLTMVFNSLTFVVFFACVLVLHSLPFASATKKINLSMPSFLFYAAWNPPFVILLWISTVVDWYAAQGLVKAQRPATRHAWMLLSVVANLSMLGYFKYGQFLLDNCSALMTTLGVPYHPPHYDIVLPVGISFYTFATMSYTLDVYLRRAAPARNLLDYALFVTFFPHLVAGPIMRPTELVPQFAQPRRAKRGAAALRAGAHDPRSLQQDRARRQFPRERRGAGLRQRQNPGSAGCLHGVYLAVERALRARFANYRPGPLVFVALGLLTYTLVNVTWVFFRAKTFGKAWSVLRGMFGQNAAAKPILATFNLLSVAAIVGGILLTHWLMRARTLESVIARAPALALSMIWALMAFAIVIAQGAGNAFIYFQF